MIVKIRKNLCEQKKKGTKWLTATLKTENVLQRSNIYYVDDGATFSVSTIPIHIIIRGKKESRTT